MERYFFGVFGKELLLFAHVSSLMALMVPYLHTNILPLQILSGSEQLGVPTEIMYTLTTVYMVYKHCKRLAFRTYRCRHLLL